MVTDDVTLRAVRLLPRATAFDPCFFATSPLFWPIRAAAETFVECTEWPDVADYARALPAGAGVRFEKQEPRPGRRRGAERSIDPARLYDGRIALEGCIPTRPGTWHDFLNALVWATFPRAKRALHERQHRAIAARVPPGATRLPGARTRELDALALLDEGGVVVLHEGERPDPTRLDEAILEGRAVGAVFGHALYEGLVLDVRSTIARAWLAPVEGPLPSGRALLERADRLLAESLASGAPLLPEMLPRISLAPLARMAALGEEIG